MKTLNICQTCGKTFQYKSKLNRHVNQVHRHDESIDHVVPERDKMDEMLSWMDMEEEQSSDLSFFIMLPDGSTINVDDHEEDRRGDAPLPALKHAQMKMSWMI